MSDWYLAESRGRCALAVELHPQNLPENPESAHRSVPVGPKVKANAGDYYALQRAVSQAVGSVPAHWDMVFIVLPRTVWDSGFHPQQLDGVWAPDATHKETVVLNSWVFATPDDRDWTFVVHESLHCFGLLDQYGESRFPAWTIMGCSDDSWHLLGWEKLLLGWLDIDDFLWLRSGAVEARLHEMAAPDGHLKGIVIFDEAIGCAYVVERAQPTGRTAAAHDAWSDHGILRYRVNLDGTWPQIAPLVAAWGNGGANSAGPKAVHPAPKEKRSVLDVGANTVLEVSPLSAAPPNWIATKFGRRKPASRGALANVLYQDEYIEAANGDLLLLTPFGDLEIWNSGALIKRMGPDRYRTKEYGFHLTVGDDGAARIYQGLTEAERGALVWSSREIPWLPPGGASIGSRIDGRRAVFAIYAGGPTETNPAQYGIL